MPNIPSSERLSWGDSIFLYLERDGAPLHVASVSFFEGDIPFDHLVNYIESKIPLIPRYRQRIVAPPFNVDLPKWEYDPEFNIRNHVREVVLKRGTDAELKTAIDGILSAALPRERPLWDFTLFKGLKHDRSAILARLHHCLADGIAGVGLMNLMMDPVPMEHPLPKKAKKFRAPKSANQSPLIESIVGSFSYFLDRVLSVQSEILSLAEGVVAGRGRWPLPDVVQFLTETATPVERLPFNVVCKGPQKFTWAEISIDEIKEIRQVLEGGTLNDVALALVTSAIGRYSELHGVALKDRTLRIMVPVNVRKNGTESDLGNRISLLPVSIPLDVRNPQQLLHTVRRRMEFLKCAHVAELVGLFGTFVGATPLPLQAFAGPIASQLPITPFNLVCTNVPGPKFPLYLLGHKMLSWYPYVPIGGEMAVNCAILTYNGVAYFGFTGDAHAAPDLEQIPKLLLESYADLRRFAGLKVRRPHRARKKTKVNSHPIEVPRSQAAVEATRPKPVSEIVPTPPPDHDRDAAIAIASVM
jgi:diacylglycerol O-acyltransferase